ncbi:hypothetical protein KNE206_49310 [Kitasatospora sp. NE20-6]
MGEFLRSRLRAAGPESGARTVDTAGRGAGAGRPAQVSRCGRYSSSVTPKVQATPARAVRVEGGTRSQ